MNTIVKMPAIPVPFDVITHDAERLIREFMATASRRDAQGDADGARSHRAWAFGVYMLWQASAPKEIAIPRNNPLWLLVTPEDAEAPV